MESEGSDVDDLADLDLATFAQRSDSLSPPYVKGQQGDPQLDAWYDENAYPYDDMNTPVLVDTRIDTIVDDEDEDDDNAAVDLSLAHVHELQYEMATDTELQNSYAHTTTNVPNQSISFTEETRAGHSSNPFQSDIAIQSERSNVKPTNPFKREIPSTNPFAVSTESSIYRNTNPFASELSSPITDSEFPGPPSSNPFRSAVREGSGHPGGEGPLCEAEHVEYVHLNRLPGENLGMVLGIEGDQENCRPVDIVVVKSITPGGAAARACQNSDTILVGDEIREIDGKRLTDLTHDACIALLADMPDNVILTIHRKTPHGGVTTSTEAIDAPLSPSILSDSALKRKAKGPAPVPPPRKYIKDSTVHPATNVGVDKPADPYESYPNEKIPRGFVKLEVTLFREKEDSLGLSIVPSYGATCDLYQIKRLLPEGVCSRCERLDVGDRLLSCNGLSLRNLTQTQCLNVLKTSSRVTELTILRQIEELPPVSAEDNNFTSAFPDSVDSIVTDAGIVADVNQVVPSQISGPSDGGERNLCLEQEGNAPDKEILHSADIEFSQSAVAPLLNDDNEIVDASLRIPPPSEFSDSFAAQHDSDSTYLDRPECITDIDDLLGYQGGDSVLASSTSITHTEDLHNDRSDVLLRSIAGHDVSLESNIAQNEAHSTFLSEEFEGQSLEEFADQCFNSIVSESELDPTHISETYVLDTDTPTIPNDIHESEQTNRSESVNETYVTFVPVSSPRVEPTYVTTIPISSPTTPAAIPFSGENAQDPFQTSRYCTSINVNSPSPTEITQIHVASKKEENAMNSKSSSGTLTKPKPFGSVVFQTHAGSSPSTPTSARIDLDESQAQTSTMDVTEIPTQDSVPQSGLNGPSVVQESFSSKATVPTSAVPHTTLGITSVGKSIDEEALIQPMVSAKDCHGRPLCVPSSGGASNQQRDLKKLDHEAKESLVQVLTSFTKQKKLNSPLIPQEDLSSGCPEAEIIPTMLSQNQKKTVVDVLKHWSKLDVEPPEKPSFNDLVKLQSQTITVNEAEVSTKDNDPQSVLNGPSVVQESFTSKATVLTSAAPHTTLGITSVGKSIDEEALIQPMVSAKDCHGRPLCVPSSGGASNQQKDMKKLDHEAKESLVQVLTSFTKQKKSLGPPPVPERDRGNGHSEAEIVPTILSQNQKKTVVDVLKNWSKMEVEPSEKPSFFQKSVSNVIHFQKGGDVTNNELPVESPVVIASRPLTNATIHTTIGVSVNKQLGEEEDIIEPMAAIKDAQGKPLYLPSSHCGQKQSPQIRNALHLDGDAKSELVKAMESIPLPNISSSPALPVHKNAQDEGLETQEIIPTLLAQNQKELTRNVLEAWLSADADPSNNPSVFKKSVASVIAAREENLEGKKRDEKHIEVATSNADTVNILANGGTGAEQHISTVSVESSPGKVLTAVNIFQTSANEEHQNKNVDTSHPVLRPKSQQSADFRAKIDSFQKSPDSVAYSVTSIKPPRTETTASTEVRKTTMPRERPKSMFETLSGYSAHKQVDVKKSFETESRNSPSYVPGRLPTVPKSLSSSTTGLEKVSPRLSAIALSKSSSGGRFSTSTFVSKLNKTELPKTRMVDGSPFQVDVLKGIVGLGIKVKVTPEGHVQVTEVQRNGPIDKNGTVKVGDYLVSINSTELTGQTEARVQQILRLLSRGLVRLVVTTSPPASEPQHESSEDGSHAQYGLRVSPKPFSPDASLSETQTSLTESQTFSAAENGIGPASADPDFISPGDLTLPIFTSAERTSTTESQPVLTARIEISSGTSSNGSAPVKIAIKPSPTPRPSHKIPHSKALPHHTYASSTNESWDTSSEDSTPRESRMVLKNQKIPEGNQRESSEKEDKDSRLINARLDSNQEISESKVSPTVFHRPETQPVASVEDKQNNDLSAKPLEMKEEETSASQATSLPKEKVEFVESPRQKVPPPVAPKPRKKSSSSTSELDRNSAETPLVKNTPKISAGYERLQAISKSSKPSKIIEKSRTFVTSTAKLFDNKAATADEDHTSEQRQSQRRISLGFTNQTDATRPINSSLVPLKERRKSTGTSMSSLPITLSKPSSLPAAGISRPKSLHMSTNRLTEQSIPESPSPSGSDDHDGKSTCVTSPTRLNSALSPRRSLSSGSPTSPPFLPPSRSKVRDDKPSKSVEGKDNEDRVTKQYTGVFKSSPVTVYESSSPSPLSLKHETTPSPHSSKMSQTFPLKSRSNSFPSPVVSRTSSVSSQMSEEVLEDAMKKFDDLLIDAPITYEESDPSDMLLWAPVRKENQFAFSMSSRKGATESDVQSKVGVEEKNKPTALPRKKPEIKEKKEDTQLISVDVEKEEGTPLNKAVTDLNAPPVLPHPISVDRTEDSQKLEEKVEVQSQVDGILYEEGDCRNGDANIHDVPSEKQQENDKYLIGKLENQPESSTEDAVQSDQVLSVDAIEIASSGDVKNTEHDCHIVQGVTNDESVKICGKDDDIICNNSGQGEGLESIINPVELPIAINDETSEIYQSQALKLVESVMADIANNPALLRSEEMEKLEPPSPTSSEDDAPPLPGAPPPPLILRDSTLLVTDNSWLDSDPQFSDNASELLSLKGEMTETMISIADSNTESDHVIMNGEGSPVLIDLDLCGNSEIVAVVQSSQKDDESHSRADSAELLNSTDDSLQDGDAARVNSLSPVDLLSEDSGMPADEEFQEIVTDDTLTPVEYAETSDRVHNLQQDLSPSISTEEAQIASAVAPCQDKAPEIELDNTQLRKSSQATSEEEHVGQTFICENVNNVKDSSEDEDSSLSPPVLPTTSPPSVNALHDVTSIVQDPAMLQNITVSPMQSSDSPQSSLGSTIPGDAKTIENDSCVESDVIISLSGSSVCQTSSVSVTQSEVLLDDVEEISVQSVQKDSKLFSSTEGFGHADQSLLEPNSDENESCLINSSRKWGLCSNTCLNFKVQGSERTEVQVHITLPVLSAVLSDKDFVAMVDKANKVLDKMSASDDMELIVIHLHRDGDSAPLGLDLKQISGPWYKVSSIHPGSPVSLEGSLQEGDWLLAVDNLWCDTVSSVMRLLGRITKPKHDSLLVVGRGNRLGEGERLTERPTPVPRMRAASKGVQKASNDGESSMAENTETRSGPDTNSGSSKDVSMELPADTAPAPMVSTTESEVEQCSPDTSIPPSSSTTAATVMASNELPTPSNESQAGVGVGSVLKVIMMKGVTGVGFCLEGGVGSPKGNLPIAIKRIFKGGPAEKCGQLKVKDEILEVNGVDFNGMRHYEAWNHLKFLDDGEVHLTVRRKS